MSTITTAYGSITIVDVTDIGELSVYPESNAPLSVVYDPNQNTYTPNWGDNPVELEPVVYYAGKLLTASTTGLKVTWYRRDGIETIDTDPTKTPSNLVSDEIVSNNKLTISANKLKDSNSGLLTYICVAQYIEPDAQTTLTAKGQITFTLVENASDVKQCRISGTNVFKYNTNGALVGDNYITLTATLINVQADKWQYKNKQGEWNSYPVTSGHNDKNTNKTLNVYAVEDVFIDDTIATLRFLTKDESVYDTYTIVKLRDGAAGSGTVAAVLSNDDQWIACDSSGNPEDDALEQAKSTITILEGGKDVTSSWTITCTPTGATGSYNNTTHTYTVTGISASQANIEFKCTKEGYTPIYKNFSLTKLIAAQDGISPTIYSIAPSVLAANRSIENIYSPDKVTFTAYSKTGASDRSEYAGHFKIYLNNNTDPTYTSLNDETSCSYTFNGNSLKSVRCVLYAAGGGGNPLDSQTVVVTNDGATGADGQPGEKGDSAINIVLGNQADIIPCDNEGKVKSAMEITIPFTGYKGISTVACSVVPSGLPGGITVKSNIAATASTNGKLTLSVAAGGDLGNTDSGVITLTFTCEGTQSVQNYQWSKSIQALNGVNAVLFQLFAPNGNVIVNGENSVIIQAYLLDGSVNVTEDMPESITYSWTKYEDGKYSDTPIGTGKELTVEASDVSGYASYRCIATYNSKPYTAYFAVTDKTDPIQAYIYCSLGTQILNGQGRGAVYVKIFRNGEEIDRIKSERFLTEAPSGASGDFYYHLDTANKTVVLKKHNGSTWVDATGDDLPTATYTYSFRDKDGNILTDHDFSTSGKAIYIDGSLFEKKIIIDVSVTI